MRKLPGWLMLVSSLAGQNQTARMRIWRALKFCGAGALRDGVYLLPQSPSARRLLQEQADAVAAAGGSAHIVAFESSDDTQQQAFQALFDRSDDYSALFERLQSLQSTLSKMDEVEARKTLGGIRRELTALAVVDFFPGPSRHQVESVLADAEVAINARYSGDEPHALAGEIPRCDRKDFRGRAWVTREHLWIDRVCSAWLIRRFIDPKATFLWLKRPQDGPKKALGFDFDGARFSHVGAKVTFEVLLTSFGLEHDRGLSRLGALVHYLDVGGVAVAEAAGFAAIMAGARATQASDDALLKTIMPVLDQLYAAYSEATSDAMPP
jgi:hypothetical protein